MARKRMIAPEFFTSASINRLSIPAAMTFVGLWCYADDDGRAEDDVDLIRAAIWPRRKDQTERRIAGYLDDMAGLGLLCRYDVNGYRLLHIPSWREHQKISHPTPSKIAPCSVHDPDDWEEFRSASDTARERFRSLSGVSPETFRSDSTPIELNVVEGRLVQSSSSPSMVRDVTSRGARAASGGDGWHR